MANEAIVVQIGLTAREVDRLSRRLESMLVVYSTPEEASASVEADWLRAMIDHAGSRDHVPPYVRAVVETLPQAQLSTRRQR